MANAGKAFVSGHLATVLRITRFLGLTPLRFVKHRDGWLVRISPWFTKLGYFVTFFSCTATLWYLFTEIFLGWHLATDKTRLKFIIMSLLNNIGSTLWASFAAYGSKAHAQCIVNTFQEMEKIKSKLNINKWPRQRKREVIGLLIFWTLLGLTLAIAENSMGFYQAIKLFPVLGLKGVGLNMRLEPLKQILVWIFHISIVQFAFFAEHVRCCFQAINNNFQELFPQENQVSADIKVTKKVAIQRGERARGICSAYVNACDVVRAVSRAYGFIVTMFLSISFLRLVTKPYIFLHVLGITGSGDQNYNIFMFTNIFWLIFYLVNLWIIFEPCHLTHVEMEKTRQLVSHLQESLGTPSTPLALELDHFQKYIIITRVKYKPLNLCTISRSLILASLNQLITYMILIIDIELV